MVCLQRSRNFRHTRSANKYLHAQSLTNKCFQRKLDGVASNVISPLVVAIPV